MKYLFICMLFISLSAASSEMLIPEILDLKPGDTLNEETYLKYNSKLIAISIVQWLRAQKNDSNLEKSNYDLRKNTRIAMAFDVAYLPEIIKKGFLNQHETGKSKGLYNLHKRATQENSLLKLNLEPSYGQYGPLVNRVRPKYAYLLLDNQSKDESFKGDISTQYGDVYAVFTDDVKDRSTFTGGDSLDMEAGFGDVYTFWYESYLTLQQQFWEVQIWGDLGITDVKYFLVNCHKPLGKEKLNKLKGTRRPVYDCKERKTSDGIYNLIRAKRL
jgi:hypothetical protein